MSNDLLPVYQDLIKDFKQTERWITVRLTQASDGLKIHKND